MKILWLSPNLLLPLDKGGKLRTWHLMRHLTRRHHITFLSFADPDAPEADRAGMSEVCAELDNGSATRSEEGQRHLPARCSLRTSCAGCRTPSASTALRI